MGVPDSKVLPFNHDVYFLDSLNLRLDYSFS